MGGTKETEEMDGIEWIDGKEEIMVEEGKGARETTEGVEVVGEAAGETIEMTQGNHMTTDAHMTITEVGQTIATMRAGEGTVLGTAHRVKVTVLVQDP